MRMHFKAHLIIVAMLYAAVAVYAAVSPVKDVLWLDFDMRNIPEPKERPASYYTFFFDNEFVEQFKRWTDIPNWVRAATDHPKEAANVNAVDEVPDSSWYTNRHHLRPMTMEALARGPNQSDGPDFSRVVITKAKTGGVTPGLQVKDNKGNTYIIKFDGANYPEMQSAAEVISTKILYAAGYNVPENYVAYVDTAHLEIGDGVQVLAADRKTKRPFTRQDLDEMLRRVARHPDGRYRVLASKFLPGKPKGPFPQIGIRLDDPNDLFPHEHRRELRGLRVIASWIGHWDMKEQNGLDMYVEEGGRKFLRHYLLDFGATLGADDQPTQYYHGREYALDARSVFKELFSLGLYTSNGEKTATVFSPAVGSFGTDDFDPAGWKPSFPTAFFQDMTDRDAFWSTRVILSFTEPELRRIVETGEYSNPKDGDHLVEMLLERRRVVAQYWLGRANPIANFTVAARDGKTFVEFRDLMGDGAEYKYQIKSSRYRSAMKTTTESRLELDRDALSAAKEYGHEAPIEVTIWTTRSANTTAPVKIFLYRSGDRGAVVVGRISRS